ncbi:DUF11 domain-containing protein [uncultured Methanobrevibacter sp.]|uniref:DUF11 domain-containing protein n=1 Tax=uncultured Methanobrevibacter sp. TaxID=253161 RepID=UPI0025CC97C8|nr:DUF11 domain-containing protein [uncultured Methanobrevibacter sp.]
MNYKVILASLILVTLLFSLSAVSADDSIENQTVEISEIVVDDTQDLNSNDLSNVSDSNNATVETSAYLVLDNDADKENIYLGDLVTWIITVQNFGPDISKNTQVRDELPDGLEYVSHTLTVGSFNPETGIWDIGDLDVKDGEVALYITCKAISVGEKINKAWLTSDTPNLNNETFEEEEIDVLDYDNYDNDNDVKKKVTGLKAAGNPIFLILMSLIIIFSGFVVKR